MVNQVIADKWAKALAKTRPEATVASDDGFERVTRDGLSEFPERAEVLVIAEMKRRFEARRAGKD